MLLIVQKIQNGKTMYYIVRNPRCLIMFVLRYFRMICAIVFSIVLLSTALLISLLTIQIFAVPLWYRVARLWGKGCLWIMGVRIIEENQSTLQGQQARVVMFNHESVLDILWLCAISPPAFSTVTKNLFRFIPLINLAFWASGQVFIKRSNNKQAVAALQKLASHCRDKNRTIVISPEGSRTTNGELLPFKKGGFYILLESHFPLHIVLVHNAFQLMPPGAFAPHPGTLYIRYLPIIKTNSWTKEHLNEHISTTREHMCNAIQKMNTEHRA